MDNDCTEDGMHIPESLFMDMQILQASSRYDDLEIKAPHEYVDKALDILEKSPLELIKSLDIDRALEINYPEDKKAKLFTRQKEANELLSTQQKRPFHAPVPQILNKHPTIQVAADCININRNEEFGRFIEASRDISAGEILAVEESYAIGLFQQYKLIYCGECGELCINMIPCQMCCAEMYCSKGCREKAFMDYHKYECAVRQYYDNNFMEMPLGWISLRTTLKGLKEYKNLKNEDTTIYKSNRYKEISELVSQINKLSHKIIMELSYNVAKTFIVLKKHTDLLSKFDVDDKENVLKYLLLRDKLMNSANDIPIMAWTPNNNNKAGYSYGAGLYSFCSLFNHSCVENVVPYSYGSTAVLMAYKKIRKGEQCFINYGLPYLSKSKSKRQKTLESRHLFNCACKACAGNWPMNGEGCLSSRDLFSFDYGSCMKILKVYNKVVSEDGKMLDVDEDSRKKYIDICYKLAEEIENEEPSHNHVALYEIFDKLLRYGNSYVDF